VLFGTFAGTGVHTSLSAQDLAPFDMVSSY
jgi:hypothetical protein